MRKYMLVAVLVVITNSFVTNASCNNTYFFSEGARPTFVTPQMFGAKGDGKTNDTKAFQKCLEVCDSIYVPAGDYVVTLQHRRNPSIRNGIVIDRSNVKITFAEGAVIKGVIDESIPKPKTGYDFQYNDYNGCIIWIRGNKCRFIENVVIDGGTFIGVRSDFAMSTRHNIDESGNGIRIEYTKNAIVRDCTIRDNQGDNILAYYNKDLLIEGVYSYDCRRTGISVGPSEGFTIEHCSFYNNGCDKDYNGRINYATSPMNAICLEGDIPNGAPLKKFNNIVVRNCYCESDALFSGSENYKFIGRNTPGFVEIGQLAKGGGNIVVENNHVVQSGNSSGAINIHMGDSYVKSISVIGNDFAFRLTDGSLSSTSNHLLVLNGNLDKLLVKNNKYTNNVRFVYLYQSNSSSSIKNIDVDGNVSNNINGNADKQMVESYHGKVNNLTIVNNHHYGRCVELLGSCNKISIKNNEVVGNYTGVSGGALFYCITGVNCKVEIANNHIEAYYKDNTGQPWYIMRGSIEYLDSRKRLISQNNTTTGKRYVKTGDFLLLNNDIRCDGEYLSMFSSNTFNGTVSGNTIKAKGYRQLKNAYFPSKNLKVTDNKCVSLPVTIIDGKVENVRVSNNQYTK